MVAKRLVLVIGIACILAALPCFASSSATKTDTARPSLVINVTVQKTVVLTLASGAGCNVSAGSDYSMNLGTVDMLAIISGCAAPTTPYSVSTNTLSAYVPNTFAKTR